MPFPVTVDASVSGAEQPGKFATFHRAGTDRYQIQFLYDKNAGEGQLVAMKSTDAGATWAEVDAGNGPVGSSLTNAFPYTTVKVSAAELRIAYLELGQGAVTMTGFDMSSDTWTGGAAQITPPISSFGSTGEGSLTLGQYCAVYRPLSNDVVFVCIGSRVTLDDVNHALCWFGVYDVAGDSWTAGQALGFVDYSDITTWDMIPCGIALGSTGLTHVFMQQVARAGPGNAVFHALTTPGPFSLAVPLDAPATGDADLWGGGAGGNPGSDVGSGGGGGAETSGTVNLTPGGTLDGTIGDGGLSGNDGTATTCQTLTANPGTAGIDGVLAAPGLGGTGGDHDGGDGGTTNDDGMGGATTGGGGGGSALKTADGSNGQAGQATVGGAGGAGQGQGGAGGNDGVLNPPTQGQAGGSPGAGGGGHGVGGSAGGNDGGPGELDVTWISVRNTHGCRMYQQAIRANNTLGALAEITQGAYPSRAKGANPVPLSFDAAALSSQVRIAFTGATSTSGRDNILVGAGVTADPIAFSFSSFSSGNGGDDVDACPALAMTTGATFCCYISGAGADINFVQRSDTGSGFGAPSTIGTLPAPDDREFGRLQATVIVDAPEITFGVPSAASLQFTSLD